MRRIAIAAVLAVGLTALLPLGARAATSIASSTGGAGFVQQPLTAPKGAFAGKTATIDGHLDDYAGTVSLTARRGTKGDFLPIGTARADASGDFSFIWKPGKSGVYSVRIAPATSGLSTASVDSTQGSVKVYRRQKATWYGPESYGSRTACGVKLTKKTLGVAHRTLPCGTKVEFFLRGKRITVPVIDRGPYANGAIWDLTLTAMKKLGSSSTEYVGAIPLD
ncbi:MAG: septal ring lytic transglycosylase RlpA family protein [Solirubrobacterales bacterium]